jgi:hypothetical protein
LEHYSTQSCRHRLVDATPGAHRRGTPSRLHLAPPITTAGERDLDLTLASPTTPAGEQTQDLPRLSTSA